MEERRGLTANRLSYGTGLNAQQMNFLLYLQGFQDGIPGGWFPTEKGKQYAIPVYKDNGYGGRAARRWEWAEWDEAILDVLDLSTEACAEARATCSEYRRKQRETQYHNSAESSVNTENQFFDPNQSSGIQSDSNNSGIDWTGIILAGLGTGALYILKKVFEKK